MTKETSKAKDSVITLQDIDNNKHVFRIKVQKKLNTLVYQ